MIDYESRYLDWLRGLSFNECDIILRYNLGSGWRAKVASDEFVLWSAYADDPTETIGTLLRSRELTIDEIERARRDRLGTL